MSTSRMDSAGLKYLARKLSIHKSAWIGVNCDSVVRNFSTAKHITLMHGIADTFDLITRFE